MSHDADEVAYLRDRAASLDAAARALPVALEAPCHEPRFTLKGIVYQFGLQHLRPYRPTQRSLSLQTLACHCRGSTGLFAGAISHRRVSAVGER
ncbi:hypothetical protein OKW42_003557 [Paraburkholderia sp. WC7.3d]